MSKTPPEAHWPVVARNLLTDREQMFYRTLVKLYPDHKIFIQVALSQLIEVSDDHPDRQSIRNRFSQLVADFVLSRSDLTVVAVIELDDRSHERRDRQFADARKTKALADAGLRLVRIPAGPLPSEQMLREIIGGDEPAAAPSRLPNVPRFALANAELRLADAWGTPPTGTPELVRDRATSRAARLVVLKAVLGGAVIVGGWFIYSQLVPAVMQRAFQPLAVQHVPNSSMAAKSSLALAPSHLSAMPVVAGLPQQDLAEKRSAELQAAADIKQQKHRAWLAYYSAPASCEHPVDWKAQLDCGNQYMRAKKEFEKRWLTEGPSGDSTAATAIVLDNRSIAGKRN